MRFLVQIIANKKISNLIGNISASGFYWPVLVVVVGSSPVAVT